MKPATPNAKKLATVLNAQWFDQKMKFQAESKSRVATRAAVNAHMDMNKPAIAAAATAHTALESDFI
jgi:predicted RNase H-like nuclease (RuvC/YqgF family)